MAQPKLTRSDIMELSIEQLLDIPFDEIAEISFVVPPRGAYILSCNACKLSSVGEGEKKTAALVMGFVVEETTELTDDGTVALPNGTEIPLAFVGGGSISFLRTTFGPLAEQIQAVDLRALTEKMPGVKFTCIIGHRRDEAKDRTYPTFNEVRAV